MFKCSSTLNKQYQYVLLQNTVQTTSIEHSCNTNVLTASVKQTSFYFQSGRCHLCINRKYTSNNSYTLKWCLNLIGDKSQVSNRVWSFHFWHVSRMKIKGWGGGGEKRKETNKTAKENVHSHFRVLSTVWRYPWLP